MSILVPHRRKHHSGSSLPATDLSAHFDAALGVTKDGSDRVSDWTDQVGAFDLAQATSGNQPLWLASQLNSLPAISFDDSARYLKQASGTLTPAMTVYIVGDLVTYVSNHQWLGAADSSRYLRPRSGDGVYRGYSGATKDYNIGLTAAYGWGVITWVVNGASSEMRRDKQTAVTGDSGSGSWTGLLMGSDTGTISTVQKTCELAIYESAHSTAQQDEVIDFLSEKYSLGL